MRRMMIAAGLGSVLAASLAFAQAQPGPTTPAPSQAPERQATRQDQNQLSKGLPAGLVKASDLVGTTVENQNGDNLGKIEDLMVDPNANRVDFVIFQPSSKFFNGAETSRTTPPANLGTSAGATNPNSPAAAPSTANENRTARDDYYAVPVRFFSESGKKLTLSADRNKILGAPHFSKDKWPDLSGATWRENVDRYYGLTAPSTGGKLVRAHDLLNKNVRNPQNENLGKIEDLVLDLHSGRVRYAVLEAGGFLGVGDKYFAVPLSAFTASPNAKDYVMQASKDQFKNAKGFDSSHWPTTASRDWSGNQTSTNRSSEKKS